MLELIAAMMMQKAESSPEVNSEIICEITGRVSRRYGESDAYMRHLVVSCEDTVEGFESAQEHANALLERLDEPIEFQFTVKVLGEPATPGSNTDFLFALDNDGESWRLSNRQIIVEPWPITNFRVRGFRNKHSGTCGGTIIYQMDL